MIYKYDVFLSHASEDKKDFVKSIYEELNKTYIVWYDEQHITWGDELDIKIEEGLKYSKYGIVVLSHNYLAKHKEWTQFEFERILRNNKIRPIFHNITMEDIRVKYPNVYQTIKNISAIPSSKGIDYIIEQAKKAIGEDSLCSEKEVDYSQLRDLLKAGQWKEADQETLAVMLKATGGGWLSIESIENFPCTDLRTIDQLWVKYSGGRFGFSVQKRIWENVGKDYEKFGDRVGWRKGMFWNKEWLYYNELTFSTNAPQGHLPLQGTIGDDGTSPEEESVTVGEIQRWWAFSLFSRVQTCKL